MSLLVASFLHVGFGGALPTPRIALFVRPSVSNEIPGQGSGVWGRWSGVGGPGPGVGGPGPEPGVWGLGSGQTA